MAASDWTQLDGGRFEFFTGTKNEAADIKASRRQLPSERVVSAQYPGAGWAVVQQGNMVVHRAAPLRTLAERTSFLVSYVATNLDLPETNVIRDYTTMDPDHIIYPEWGTSQGMACKSKNRPASGRAPIHRRSRNLDCGVRRCALRARRRHRGHS